MIKAKEKAQNQQAGLWLTLLLAVMVLLNYVDRGAVGIAAPKLKDELMLSAAAFGIAVSAFSWITRRRNSRSAGCPTAFASTGWSRRASRCGRSLPF